MFCIYVFIPSLTLVHMLHVAQDFQPTRHIPSTQNRDWPSMVLHKLFHKWVKDSTPVQMEQMGPWEVEQEGQEM